ncbi:Protein CBG26879 [Caenorhabditis briggsae]|uniref:Uncharacterized protein n=2 Tax=Caenorhabditis briggsae TaxID=6238 RepID=A0AAE9A022_CAEBR|nr:Protein CBG26879 [Caenorhabditis briggsae]ULT86002.1 hypothetical protein L3Y34_005999 [Caenorhabditis briggsae]CAR99609.1 Protein CBG26879 [Caenorhabditis briggsae]
MVGATPPKPEDDGKMFWKRTPALNLPDESDRKKNQNTSDSEARSEVHTDTPRPGPFDAGPDRALNTLSDPNKSSSSNQPRPPESSNNSSSLSVGILKMNSDGTEEQRSNSERYFGQWSSIGSNDSLRAAARTPQNEEETPRAEAASPVTPPTVRQMPRPESQEAQETPETVRHHPIPEGVLTSPTHVSPAAREESTAATQPVQENRPAVNPAKDPTTAQDKNCLCRCDSCTIM